MTIAARHRHISIVHPGPGALTTSSKSAILLLNIPSEFAFYRFRSVGKLECSVDYIRGKRRQQYSSTIIIIGRSGRERTSNGRRSVNRFATRPAASSYITQISCHYKTTIDGWMDGWIYCAVFLSAFFFLLHINLFASLARTLWLISVCVALRRPMRLGSMHRQQ